MTARRVVVGFAVMTFLFWWFTGKDHHAVIMHVYIAAGLVLIGLGDEP